MCFSYVKPLSVGKADFGLVVGVEVSEDHTGQTAFEAAQCFGGGGTGIKSCAVVGLAESV